MMICRNRNFFICTSGQKKTFCQLEEGTRHWLVCTERKVEVCFTPVVSRKYLFSSCLIELSTESGHLGLNILSTKWDGTYCSIKRWTSGQTKAPGIIYLDAVFHANEILVLLPTHFFDGITISFLPTSERCFFRLRSMNKTWTND